MPHRLPQVNKELQRAFGEALQKEADLPAGVLVTVTRVETKPNLRSARVWLSIFPLEQAAPVLQHVQSQLYHVQGFVNQKLRLNPPPRIILRHDTGSIHAEKIEKTIQRLRRHEQSIE